MISGFVKTAQTRARTLVWRLRRRLGRPMKPGDGLRILFYHRVADDPGDLLAVTRDVFEAEMALLAERGYEVLDVVEALDRLYAGTLEPNTIALTFDDGYVDNAVHALPVLERHGFRGTVFVVTDLVSGKGGFAKGHGSPAPLLGWEEIQRLDGRSPLTFEAHTVTHPNLADSSDAESWAEIDLSRRALGDVLGRPSLAFCYPGGFLGPREHEYVRRSGFRYAITTEPGLNTAETDPFLVRRTQMNRGDRLVDFAAKLDGSHDVSLLGRKLYRRLKYGASDPLEQVRRASGMFVAPPLQPEPVDDPPEADKPPLEMGPSGATSLAAGSAWLFVTQGIANVGFFVAVLLLARGLVPADRGTTAFLTLTMFVLGRAAMLGIPEASAVFIAKDRRRGPTLVTNLVISSALMGAALGGLVALLFVAIGSRPAGISDQDLVVIAVVVPIATVVYGLVAFFVGAGHSFVGGILNMLHPWIYTATLLVIVAFSTLSPHLAAVAWGVGMAGALLPAIVSAHRTYGFGVPRLSEYVEAVRFGALAWLGTTLKFLNFRIDQLLMGFITTEAVLGIYAVAVNGSEILLYLPSATGLALLPVIARSSAVDQSDRTLRAFRILMVITVPGTAVAMAVGTVALPLLFGASYEDSVSAFLLLAPGAIGYTAMTVFSSAALGIRLPLRSSVGAAVAFVFGLVFLILLVPTYEADGAALAATIAFTAGGVVQVIAHWLYEPFPLRELVPGAHDVRDTFVAGRRVARGYVGRGRRAQGHAGL
jgi:O-antigen/teichoic acid export membrane protein/peptidoglycan/xylan/chitin deacetylase (PgdA/CDA1 family)